VLGNILNGMIRSEAKGSSAEKDKCRAINYVCAWGGGGRSRWTDKTDNASLLPVWRQCEYGLAMESNGRGGYENGFLIFIL
jgi:hypothetical protein